MKYAVAALTAAALVAVASPVAAQQKGTLTLGVGVGLVAPKSDNGTLAGGTVDVGNSVRPTITLEYFLRDNLGVELLGATPFKHTIAISGLGDVGTTKQLPPVISVNWHFPTGGAMTPFVGVGLNYTFFFSEKTSGALAGNTLDLKNTLGVALHAGVDVKLSERGALRADLRWVDIRPDVYLNGSKIGKVNVSPLVAGISYVHRF